MHFGTVGRVGLGSTDKAGNWVWGSVHGRGKFGSECGAPIVTSGEFDAACSRFVVKNDIYRLYRNIGLPCS